MTKKLVIYMQIIQNVTVKQIVTPKSKILLVDQYKEEILQLEKECIQLDFQKKRLQKQMVNQKDLIEAKFKKEFQKRQEKIEHLQFSIEQINHLPVGSLIKEKEVQAIIQVDVGDDWSKLSEKTIVLEDGKIKEILNK